MSNNYEQPVEPMSRVEDILRGDTANVPQSRVEDLLKQLIEQGGGGGGSTVIVTQILDKGVKIASISVNGSIVDIYAPEDTGSEVSISTIQQTGTKIATLTIDNTNYDIYAPEGGGGGTHTENKTLTFLNTTTPFNVGDNFISAVGVFTHDSSYSLQIAVNGAQGIASRLHNGVVDGTSSSCTYINGVFTFDSTFVVNYCGTSSVDFECLYSGGSGGGNLYGTTDPTSNLGSNGDIYMKYGHRYVNTSFISSTTSIPWGSTLDVTIPDISTYDSLHIEGKCMIGGYGGQPFDEEWDVDDIPSDGSEAVQVTTNGDCRMYRDGDTLKFYNTVTAGVIDSLEGAKADVPYIIDEYGKIEGAWCKFPGYSETVLYTASQTEAPNILTLSESYKNFDALVFTLGRVADGSNYYEYDRVYLCNELNVGEKIQLITYTEYASYTVTSETEFTLLNSQNLYIDRVIGIKYGNGGGSSSSLNYSTEEQVVGKWIDGKPIYELTLAKAVNFPGSNTWKTLGIAMSTYNIKQIFDVTIVGTENTNNVPALLHPESVEPINGDICVYHNFNWNMTSSHIILRYTKTTD